jgi:hypothetical protein
MQIGEQSKRHRRETKATIQSIISLDILEAVRELSNFCTHRMSDIGFGSENSRRMIEEDSRYLNWGCGISRAV